MLTIFHVSTKQPRKSTLPKGQYGRGRYTFIWIADKLIAYSKGKKLTLQHSTEIKKEHSDYSQNGTKINFEGIYAPFSNLLLSPNLQQQLALEFCWFLRENSNYKILINNAELVISELVKDSKIYTKNELPEKVRNEVDDEFNAEIVLWNQKPSEYSRFYFLNKSNRELYKQNTGLNKKSDDFWHSVYIKSSLFDSVYDVEDDENDSVQGSLSFGDKKRESKTDH